MKKLLIVESPAKIKTIGKFLGKDFKIMSTMGHIKDLPENRLGVTVNGSIDIEYVVLENKEKTIAEICKAASTSDEIYLAPDPDREGEIIAWHVDQEIEKTVKDPKRIHRISFNEITKDAILAAIDNPSVVDMKKVAAQQARRVLDRWVGYEVSPILWRRVAKGLSAGRVQSVALRLICEREEAIRNFKPEEYWSITGQFKHDDDVIQAELTQIGKKKAEIGNKELAADIVAKIKQESFIVDAITDKKRIKNPMPPFITSTLQQAAFNRLGFPVKKTMQLAQQLYEGIPLEDKSTPVALITYMRTDSVRIADTALASVRSFITKNFDKKYLPSKAHVYTKKGKAQDAHEAIRPIDISMTPEKVARYIPKDAARLYELIWKRFVACQMESAEYAQRQVTIKGGQFVFKVTGSTLLFDGFLRVYAADEDEKEEKVVLPQDLAEKDSLAVKAVTPKQHFTQPPPKYTEASLVKEMEKEGIGRPSTYATILQTIQTRSYTTLDSKKRFTPTELGMTVNKLLVANLPDIMDIKFTARLEEDLDKIAQGDLERDTLLRDFYVPFSKDLKAFAGDDGKKLSEDTGIICPECKKGHLVIRFGKAGEFLGCNNFPKCTFTSNFKRNDAGKIELVAAPESVVLEQACPQCGKPLRKLIGKFGPFTACSGYPECKYILREVANFVCPQCKKGQIIKRRWRGGTLWGCSQYPACQFAIFGDIHDAQCPQCKAPYLLKKVDKNGTVTLSCAQKDCSYKKVINSDKTNNTHDS
jgi:DNA topoisomerase-1